MPRPDGKLYEYEKAALKAEADKGKPKARMGRPPKPKPIPPPEPVIIKETFAEGMARVASDLEEKGGGSVIRMARNGRPLKASAELIDRIIESIRVGMTIDKSCILHGVTAQALDKWKKANAGIMHRFQQADLEGEKQLVEIIRLAAPKDWKAANWLLERRHEWEQRSRTEVTGKDGGPVLTVNQILFSSVAKGGSGIERNKVKKVKGDAITV